MKRNIEVLVEGKECTYFSAPFKEGLNEKKSIKDMTVFNNQRVSFVIEGKELLIEEITLQKSKKLYIEQMIECILIKRFHSLENIAYNFKSLGKSSKEVRVLVYCINLTNNIMLDKDSLDKIKLKSVKVVQQIYAEAFKKILRKKNFMGIVILQNYVYFFQVKNKALYANKVEEFSFYSEVVEIVEGMAKGREKEDEVIYFYEYGSGIDLQGVTKSINNAEIIKSKHKSKEKYTIKFNENYMEA